MQRRLYDHGNRRNLSLKRALANSKREVTFDAPRKKSRSRTSSRNPSSSLDQVLILTSRPNSRGKKEDDANPLKPIASVSATRFYETPKSLLERQYERNLSRFLPTCPDTDFQPLELQSSVEEVQTSMKDEELPEKTLGEVKKEAEMDVNESQEVTEVPEMTESILTDLCSNKAENSDFQIAMLVRASEFFLHKAYSSVLDANDIQGTKTYYSYIKAALKSLFVLIDKYATKLSLKLELVIYYSISRILFFETDNLDLADTYIHKAISLSSRNNLTSLAVTSELLYHQILEASNPNLVEAFLSEKQAAYLKKGMKNISDLFIFLRASHLLVTSQSVGQLALESLMAQHDLDPTIRILTYLNQASLLLYRGSPIAALEQLRKLDITQIQASEQFLAIYHLLRFAGFIQSAQDKEAKEYMQVVTEFITRQRSNNWPGWNEDGTVHLELFESKDSKSKIPLSFQGLNSDEFVIMFYFLSGVLFLSDKSTYKKANKILSSCLEIIELQLQELTQARAGTRNFSLRLLTGNIVRLNFVRYSVYFYRTWLNFMDKTDTSGLKFLQLFINAFDEDNFTKEELCYYKLLIPRFLLLAAMHFQALGDLTASKYYFLRVKNLCSSKHHILSSQKISFLQRGLGIGCESMIAVDEYSELYMFATVHLLQITEYEIRLYSQSKDDHQTALSTTRNFLADLYLDLSSAIDHLPTKSTAFESFIGSHSMFELSSKVLSCIYLNRGFTGERIGDHDTRLISQIRALIKKVPSNNTTYLLASYVLYCSSLSLEERKELMTECLEKTSGKDENSRLMKIFFLREAMIKESEAADPERSQILQLQIDACKKLVQGKLENAQFSTLAP